MSERWPGGIVRSTPVTPTGPLQNGTAPGVWTVEQASYWIKQGLWPTAGNFLAVEDVFSTYLYTGNNGAQTISNGLNLSGQGGLVWLKNRGSALNNILIDTAQGSTFAGGKNLISNSTNAAGTIAANTFQFDSTGFSFGSAASGGAINASGNNYVSWTFRKAANFFDVVTYTGTGSARTISHSLGSAPGCIIVKRTDTTANWAVYHRSNTSAAYYEKLNLTDAQVSDSTVWNSTAPTSSVFSVGTSALTNASGGTYVAYLFAHDTASTGCIQCGTFTAGTEVNLGWEPQWVMIKSRDTADTGWIIIDNMRTWANNGTTNGDTEPLDANSSGAEYSTNYGWPTATGFVTKNLGTLDCIYIAIRRGPMKTPTLGTTVFSPITFTASINDWQQLSPSFPADAVITSGRANSSKHYWGSRLTQTGTLNTTSTDATNSSTTGQYFAGLSLDTSNYKFWSYPNGTGNYVNYTFRRAPSFFDVVCYTGDATNNRAINHNLGAVPELMIIKRRSSSGTGWATYSAPTGVGKVLILNTTDAAQSIPGFYDTAPTATTFTIEASGWTNTSGETYVNYLFASCPGVSKVGSYTGTGTTQTINCGFTTGARFVLIKRTDSTGDWYVWDSARGIVAGNDPYLLLNSTAAEVTSTDYIDTDNSGFQISSTAPAAINANGGSFIYLAIS